MHRPGRSPWCFAWFGPVCLDDSIDPSEPAVLQRYMVYKLPILHLTVAPLENATCSGASSGTV